VEIASDDRRVELFGADDRAYADGPRCSGHGIDISHPGRTVLTVYHDCSEADLSQEFSQRRRHKARIHHEDSGTVFQFLLHFAHVVPPFFFATTLRSVGTTYRIANHSRREPDDHS